MAGLLSKNVKLYMADIPSSTATDPTYAEVENVQTFPDLGAVPDNVDVTVLTDSYFHYIPGLIDLGVLEFGCLYDNSAATSNYRVLKAAQASEESKRWKVAFPDGTTFVFDGKCAVAVNGKGVNEALQFTLSIFIETDIAITDPTA